jgi:AcrR family transcriptional regulator
MAVPAGSGVEARAPLNRERLLSVAIELADGGGLGALSMRKLAQALGVEAMSLYYYVANKDALLDGIVDVVVSEFVLPDEAGDWKSALRASAISAHQALLRHRWAARLLTSAAIGPARLHHMEWLLGQLRQAGFSPTMTHHGYHALDSHIIGFTLWEVGFPDDLGDLATTFLEQLPVDQYPYLAEHIEQHLGPPESEDRSEFEFGLDLILDGLERLRDAA